VSYDFPFIFELTLCTTLFIYTRSRKRQLILTEDVDINHIISHTQGITAAHAERIVRLAVHTAMRQHILELEALDFEQYIYCENFENKITMEVKLYKYFCRNLLPNLKRIIFFVLFKYT